MKWLGTVEPVGDEGFQGGRFHLELRNGLFPAIIEEAEIFLAKIVHRVAMSIAHGHAHHD